MSRVPASILSSIVYVMLSLFVVVALLEAWHFNWLHVYLALQAFVIGLIPYALAWRFQIKIPASVQIGTLLFLFGTLVLGKMLGYYDRFYWWDLALHGYAGAGLAVLALLFLGLVLSRRSQTISLTRAAVLAVALSMLASALWEVYEFSIDTFIYQQAQMQPSNADTLGDLAIALVGALAVAVFTRQLLPATVVKIESEV